MYNLSKMKSVYCNGAEIVKITYNNSIVYQKGGPTPPSTYDIRYTTTNNQKLSLQDESDVASHTFNNNEGLIKLNANTAVPYQFFYGCTTLQRVYYSTGVTFDVAGRQHDGCSSLEYVELPSDLTALPTYCFKECLSLCEITLPSTIAYLGDFAFYQCGRDNHNNGYYQPDVKFTSATVPTASGINAFLTESAVSVTAYNTIYKLVPYESYPDYCVDSNWITSNNYIDWYDDDTTDYSAIPFYVENTTDNVEHVSFRSSARNISYSDDRINWTPFDITQGLDLPAHSRKYIWLTDVVAKEKKGIYGMDTIGGNLSTFYGASVIDGVVDDVVISDVADLGRQFLDTDNDSASNTTLVDARNLILDYVYRSHDEYNRLFKNCNALVYAPKRIYINPNSEQQCFVRAFESCTSLTHMPKLPSTAIPYSTYWNAFHDCTSLAASTALPSATHTVGSNTESYEHTFDNCVNIHYIKILTDPADPNAAQGTTQITQNVPAQGVFVKKVGATWPNGVNGIPNGWTVLEATE